MERQILLVVVPETALKARTSAKLCSKNILDAYRSFCIYGYKVTLATLDGAPIRLDEESKKEYGADYLAAETIAVSSLTQDRLSNFCTLYTILPSKVDSLDQLDALPGMEDTLFHFCSNNKLVVVQHTEGYQFLNPKEYPIDVANVVDDMGCVPAEIDVETFAQIAMAFSNKVINDKSQFEPNHMDQLYADLTSHAIAS